MHAFLVTGGTKEKRLERIAREMRMRKIAHCDERKLQRPPESSSMTIEDVRMWQKQMIFMPVASKLSAGIIEDADALTIEAQNALLKTLEEPPSHAVLFLEAQSTAPLLATVLSRCQILTIAETQKNDQDDQSHILTTLEMLSDENASYGKKMTVCDREIPDKEKAKIWVTQALSVLQTNRTKLTKSAYMRLAESLLSAHRQLSANVSYKLVLDCIFLAENTGQE